MRKILTLIALSVLLGCGKVFQAKVIGTVYTGMEGSETLSPMPMAAIDIVNKKGEVVATAFTGLDGRFQFEERIPFGSYKVVVRPASGTFGFPPHEEHLTIRKPFISLNIKVFLKSGQ
ncbi:MAG: carboxypeptidase-like regulatory domain-containing protein [bacterium JZ-2024 1]